MDSLVVAASRALAAGDALGALKRIALRDDPPALALRGIAMAQLGEHASARELLRRAGRGFGAHEALARARCVVAEAEVALALRELGGSPRPLLAAAEVLKARDDRANAMQARLIVARRWLLLGRLDQAADVLAALDERDDAARARRGLPPTLTAVAALAHAELALRSLRLDDARRSLAHAREAALRAGVPALLAEVDDALAAFERPAARRRFADGREQPLRLDDVADLRSSNALLLDACRRGLGRGAVWIPLVRRPILFALAQALARAWPGDARREHLIGEAFRLRDPDETHRARLRVEIGRLRTLLAPLATIEATPQGFALKPREGRDLAVLAPPIEGDQAALLALLADGAAWSTSALALALDASQRTVQRALAELEAEGRVRSIGRARSQRWLAPPIAGFSTVLLLPAALPLD